MSIKKRQYVLAYNIEQWLKTWDVSSAGFLTLTFPDNVTSAKEAQKRWNSLRANYLDHYLDGKYVLIKERQKRGAWHYHILFDLGFAPRGKWLQQGKAWKFRTKDPRLTGLWRNLREHLPLYGFGRHELLPVRTTPTQIGRYLGKYLAKAFEHKRPEDKGVRLVHYGRRVQLHLGQPRQKPGDIAWCGAFFAALRRDVRLVAQHIFQVYSFDERYEVGFNWAWTLYELASFIRQRRDIINDRIKAYFKKLMPDYDVCNGLLIEKNSGAVIF